MPPPCHSILNLSTPKTFALRTTIEEQNIEILSSQNSVPLTVADVRYILGMIPVQWLKKSPGNKSPQFALHKGKKFLN
jgi:hypothetical protein